MGNHEAKLALTGIIATRSDTWFTGADFATEIKALQTEQAGRGWAPDSKHLLYSCRRSLVPAGLAVEDTILRPRGEVAAFKANNARPETVVMGHAIGGLLMRWSMDFPDLSIQTIFGPTKSRTAFRTPELRYNIYKVLASESDSEQSYHTLAQNIANGSINAHNVNRNIRTLSGAGILETHVLDIADDIVLRIIDPKFRHLALEFTDLKHETQIVYTALQTLWAMGKREITFDQLTAEACVIDPKLDVQLLRRLYEYGYAENGMPGLTLSSRAIEARTTVKISGAHSEGLTQLVDRLEEVRGGSTSTLEKYILQAQKIMNNKQDVTTLFEKAHRFSSRVEGNANTLLDQETLLAILRESGPMTVQQVFERLAESDKSISQGAVGNFLRSMTREGLLQVHSQRRDARQKRLVNFYSALTE